MDQNNTRINCCTCGVALAPIRVEPAENRMIGQCPRCIRVDELFEHLIRKQLREASSRHLAN